MCWRKPGFLIYILKQAFHAQVRTSKSAKKMVCPLLITDCPNDYSLRYCVALVLGDQIVPPFCPCWHQFRMQRDYQKLVSSNETGSLSDIVGCAHWRELIQSTGYGLWKTSHIRSWPQFYIHSKPVLTLLERRQDFSRHLQEEILPL